MADKEVVLNILEGLGEEQFKKFKLLCPGIRECQRDKDRCDTVGIIVGQYNQQSVEVVNEVLQKINRKHSVTTQALNQDVMLQQTITSYQEKLQSNLQDRFMHIQEGWTTKKDEKPLDDVYIDLCITAGGETHTTGVIRQFEMADDSAGIEVSNILTDHSGKNKNIRTVLTMGEVETGKIFLMHKFVLDWAKKRTNQHVHLVFPFTFSELNSLGEERCSLAELIHMCVPETSHMKQEVLNDIFTTLQTSGNSNFDKSEYKLLFVLDGLDESHLQLDFTAKEKRPLKGTESTSVNVLLTNLIRGNLLPSARLWITTRPAAANQIPDDYVDMVTEVRGFTDPQKEEYFRKRFRKKKQARKIISHIKTSRSLHIMCHIPVFCWITATVLEQLLKTREGGELPKTLTQMYIHFLVVQIRPMKPKYDSENTNHYIRKLSELAFNQMIKGSLVFCEEDLEEGNNNLNGQFVYSEFSQIVKEEHQMKKGKNRVFRFVHQSVLEFLAALFVVWSTTEKHSVQSSVNSQSHLEEIYRTIDEALQSPNGHLDLFLRFLLGLSIQTNQNLLQGLMPQTGSSSQFSQLIVDYVKKKMRENSSPERSINLFHCLTELNDRSAVEEIQLYLTPERLSRDKLTPAHWSALVFILLSSEDLDMFELKKYSTSKEVLLRLLPVVKASNKALINNKDIISKDTQIRSGSPTLYQLRPKEEKIGTLSRKTFGEKRLNKVNKAILLVGEIGTGKSTLINALVNYAMGVQFEDDIWFEIVEEEEISQRESQTSDVVVYEIFGFEGQTLPFSLTIIDTPGFGDTRDTGHDLKVSDRLCELFHSEAGVHELSAVGLVMKASDNRLSDRLMYIFNSVMSLFGNDMEKNIVVLITHSDGGKPTNALEALDVAKIKCARDEENQPIYFLFNNRQHDDRTGDREALEKADKISMRGISQFKDFLEKTAPQKLKITVEVLNEQVRLRACIQNLQERVKFIELKQTEVGQTKEALKKHKDEMKKNKKFTVKVDEPYKEKVKINGGYRLFLYKGATTCNVCKENCHYPGCTMAWCPSHCEVMKRGHCLVCTNKCPVSDHVKETWRYASKTRKTEKTLQDMKDRYELNKAENKKKLSLLEDLKEEMKELTAEKTQFLEEAYQHVVRLDQIALNVDSVSTHVYMDFLIEKMKEKGDTEKVKKLEEMKSRVDERSRRGIQYAIDRIWTLFELSRHIYSSQLSLLRLEG